MAIGIDDDTVTQLIAMGAPPDVIEAARSTASNKKQPTSTQVDFELWPENLESMAFYLNHVQHQWVIVAGFDSAHYAGLNHPGIESSLNMLHIKGGKRRLLYQDMCVIEAAAKPILNKPKKE